jgi:hypothetical protein
MSNAPERYRRSYRFGPLERRGLAGGFRPSQVVLIGGASLGAVALFRRMPTAAGILVSLLLVAAACAATWFTVAGRPLDEWLPVLTSWLRMRLLGGQTARSPAPRSGTVIDLTTGTRRLPQATFERATGHRLRAVQLASGEDIGVLEDRRAGTQTVLLAVRVRSFALLAATDQERRLLRWGRAVASLARTGSPVRRLQVLERTVPHHEDELRSWATANVDAEIPEPSGIRRSYNALLDRAADVTQDHEVIVALQVAPRRNTAADAALLRELRAFSDQLSAADTGIVGALPAADCVRVIATALDPFGARPSVEPVGMYAAWSTFRTDGVLHRTFWVRQWPRLEVGPAFLAPVLLTTTAIRSVSVVVEPVSPLRSRRAVETALTSDEADEQLRQERGFRTPARKRAQHEAATRREAELAEGHEEVRFAGFVTVSGRDEDELERHCEEVIQSAQQAYLDLQPMWGQQDTGYRCGALPLCQGLVPASVLDR